MDMTIASQHLYFTIFQTALCIQYSRDAITNPRKIQIITINRWKQTHQAMDQKRNWHKFYPYKFCPILIRSILPLGYPRALYPTQLSLAVDLLDCLNLDELRGIQNQFAALTASEHPVLASGLYEQGLPVRDYYTRRLLNCSMLCPLVMFAPLFRSEHNKMIHTSDRCIEVRPCLTTRSFFVVIFNLYALINAICLTARQMAYSYVGRRRLRHMCFCDFIPAICRN